MADREMAAKYVRTLDACGGLNDLNVSLQLNAGYGISFSYKLLQPLNSFPLI
jgi:hypothetical protein